MRKFASATSLHGFRQISEEPNYPLRRVAWIFIVISALGLLLYQTGNSAKLYFSRPVAFNVQRNYLKEMRFPAVTICNENHFRITRAWEEKLYTFLEKMFDDGEVTGLRLPDPSITLTTVLDRLKHEKEDLILSCTWNSITNCTVRNFSLTRMDTSICYTFNADPQSPLVTSLAGRHTGLNLLMNIEQYELMRTGKLTAGLRVFIHDQNALPREAISIPPGMKAFVKVDAQQVTLLPRPYGVCGARPLRHFSRFSAAGCLQECRERWVRQRCGCASGVLPRRGRVGRQAECDLRRFAACVLPLLDRFTPGAARCKCPTECRARHFAGFVSFAKVSTFEVDEALHRLPARTPRRLEAAREVFFRASSDQRHLCVQGVLRPFLAVAQEVRDRIQTLWRHSSGEADVAVRRLKVETVRRFKFHRYLLERVVFAVKYNWVRGWQVARERSLSVVTFDYRSLFELMDLFEETAAAPGADPEVVRSYQAILDIRLLEKVKATERARRNLTKIHDAFVRYSPLLNYEVTPDKLYDALMNPRAILFENAAVERQMFDFLMTVTATIVRNLETLRLQLLFVAAANSSAKEMGQFRRVKLDLERRYRQFNYYTFQYEQYVIKNALRLVEKRRNHFTGLMAAVNQTLTKVNYQLAGLTASLRRLQRAYNASLWAVEEAVRRYIAHPASLRHNLTTVSALLASPAVAESSKAFAAGLDALKVQQLTLRDGVWMLQRALRHAIAAMWDDVLAGPYRAISADLRRACSPTGSAGAQEGKLRKVLFRMMQEAGGTAGCGAALASTNADWMARGQSVARLWMRGQMRSLHRVVGLISATASGKEELFFKVYRLKLFAADYLMGNKISRKFVRDNFVELQIYYQDLVSTDESQSPAYTLTQLWSDFGGNFGLLLGASVLSVVEIIDFIVYSAFRLRC